jgi:broad specificity phosphatase PhoE
MAKSNEIRVLLLRTGQTAWDQAGRLCGATDVPLSSDGLETAKQQAASLTGEQVSTILCGPDEASMATAQELAKSIGGKVKPVEGLGEVNLGLWEGLLESELEEKCPRLYRQWVEDPASVQVPEGEGLQEARDRIVEVLNRALAKTRNGAVGVVLRPLAHALVGCEFAGTSCRSVWSMMKTGPSMQWRTVAREALRRSGDKARAGT